MEAGLGEDAAKHDGGEHEAEAERVATEILNQKMRRQCKFRDFAILYRGNHQARLLEMKLQQHQIPYNMSGGTSFFARAEIKDILAYLRLLVNPDDDNAFLRIINTPRRSIGTTTLESLGRYANERHIGMLAACDEVGVQTAVSDKGLDKLREFCRWLDRVRENCIAHDPVSAIREMIDDIDYEAWLHQNASSGKVAERRMENVNYLVESIRKLFEKDDMEDLDGDIQLKNAIAKLMLMDLLDRQEEEDLSDRVQMMTLHAAKGLEFPHVFMVGMEEELLPHRTSIEEDNIEEERRLTYVGITRARQTLTMTLAGTRKQFGEKNETAPSRFLDEMPEDDLVREGFGTATKEQVTQQGQETISNILNMFD